MKNKFLKIGMMKLVKKQKRNQKLPFHSKTACSSSLAQHTIPPPCATCFPRLIFLNPPNPP